MSTFEAKIKYTDVRVITIEADSMEEAQAKYEAGDWSGEETVDFYAEEELKPLRQSK